MKQIRQFVGKIIPIITGILIALVINNWNQERKDKKYLSQIFTSIYEELEESNLDIKQTIPRQKVFLDSIELFLNDEIVSLFDIVIKAEGIRFATIKNNSWKAIANSKIELVDHKKASVLSDIEEGKEILEFQSEKLFDFLINNAEETSRRKKEIFRMIIQNIIALEEKLQSNIQELNKK